MGNLISDKSHAKFCQNKSYTFSLHTKSTDNIKEKDSKEIEQEEWFINRNPKLKVLNINVSEF